LAWSRERSGRPEAQQSARAVMRESEGGSVEDFIHCPALLSSALLPWRAWRMRFGVPGSLSVFRRSAAAEPHLFSWPGRAAFNLTVFSTVSRSYQARAGASPGPKGKKLRLWDLIILEKIVLAEFHLYSLPLSHHVCVFFLSVCVVLSHSALTQIPSYLRTAKRQLNEGKVKSMDERANDTFSNMTLWTVEVSGLYKLCSAESVWLSNGEKDKGQAAIYKQLSLAREIVPDTYRAVVSFLTGWV